MATSITLKLDTKNLVRALRRLKSSGHVAIARSLNRAGVTAQTFMAREISKDLKLKVGDVKAAIAVKNAAPKNLRVLVIARGKPISLIKFGAKGPVPSRGRGKGVTAKLPAPGKGKYPHAFIATVRSGQTNETTAVFERKGKARLPIKKLHGPSIAHVFSKFQKAGLAAGEQSLVKNLKHEFRWALQQARSGS